MTGKRVYVLLFCVALFGCRRTPVYPNCTTTAHCRPQAPYCHGGQCRACTSDQHCKGPCQTCDTKRFSCVAKPGCCTSDLGCSGGRCWTDSKTKQGTCGPQCRGDQDCSSKEECVKGSCRERCLCTKDADCSASTRCANCRCIERTCSDDHPQSPATTAKDETLTTAVSKIKGCLGAGQGKLTIVAVCSRPGAYKERGLLSKNLRWIRAGLRKVKRLHKRTSFLLVCPKKASHKLWTAHGHLAGKISWKQAP